MRLPANVREMILVELEILLTQKAFDVSMNQTGKLSKTKFLFSVTS
jgi:hypothetical protein